MQAVLAAKQWLTFTSGSPLQPAVAHALDHEPDWPRELARDLQGRRDLLCDGLAAAGLVPRVPEGTYFATTDICHLGWPDGRAFCLALPERRRASSRSPRRGSTTTPRPVASWCGGRSARSAT